MMIVKWEAVKSLEQSLELWPVPGVLTGSVIVEQTLNQSDESVISCHPIRTEYSYLCVSG